MTQRDYVARNGAKKKKQAKKGNKTLLLTLALIVIGAFAAGLYLLKEKSSETMPVAAPQEKTQPKSVLPTPPEEVWSYIKALETRTVPVDNDPQSLEKNMRLTEEQKKVLLQMEKEQKEAELARAKQAEERKKAEETAAQQQTVKATEAKPNVEKTVENKPTATKPSEVKTVEAKPAEVKTENTKPAAAAENKKVETKKTTEQAQAVKKTETAQSSAGEKKFGLQCGAFKNKEQAENMQARLAMAGFNARINSSADWNRVVIGPIGDRAAANSALERAKSVGTCVVIGM
ncbi:cell division protein FtsN [Caviibacterium pharyngocola]|uniref:Cell division protein FtsN n=1 Tax=Caviibacterium pharyngocola TaxID=28159 RepID=A0A2M8RYD4_9PAST|nr:cell division protein FtsN [Caviibacterium pharyngocola]PJG83897.1 cell division protein FtsN [Caviibacterium pharyngocola]